MIEAVGGTAILFDVMAITLSINIIVWFTAAIWFNIKIIQILRKRKKQVLFLTYLNIIASSLFTLAFLYIIIATPIRGSIIDNTSFGAIVIRPLILLQAVGTAINQKEKYGRERNR